MSKVSFKNLKKIFYHIEVEIYHYLREKAIWNYMGFVLIPAIFLRRIIQNGWMTYRQILSVSADKFNGRVYFMDYEGSGDTYLTCSYLKSRGWITNRDIFIAPSSQSANLAKYYGFGKVLKISDRKARAIRSMERFYGDNLLLLPLLYESVPLVYSGIWRHMQGHRGMDFMAMLRMGMEVHFGLEDDNKTFSPFDIPYKKEKLEDIFIQYHLTDGRVALLSPYAGRHAQDVPMKFYYMITKRLKKAGFTVFTNSSNPIEEPPVPGTTPICLPYNLLVPFISNGGVFVGQRSGLCDIIASARGCKKIILYPSKRIPEGVESWIEFFSLKKMGIARDVIEMEVQESRWDKMAASIMKEINQRE